MSTLSTKITETRRYSLCTAQAVEEVFNCKIDINKSIYNKAGRWRRLWGMDPSGQSLGAKENTVDGILQKVTNPEYRIEYVSYFVCYSRHENNCNMVIRAITNLFQVQM